MNLMVNPVITSFKQDVNGDIKALKLGAGQEDAYANIIGQAEGADLDNNKTKTIDVSTYTEPVEILPTSGKDGMKKATVTLSNIPSPSGTLAYSAYKYTEGTTTDIVYAKTGFLTPTIYTMVQVYSESSSAVLAGYVYDSTTDTITSGNKVYIRSQEDDLYKQS